VLAQRLGHSDVSITLSLYAHVRPSDDRAAAALVATAIDEGLGHPPRPHSLDPLGRPR
jgi:hypothetical protein